MINSIFKKLKNLIINSALNYKNSDLYFIRASNFIFKITRKGHRFKLSNLGDSLPKYYVFELKDNSRKFFGYRKQGFMAFENGIKKRGEHIGFEYMLDSIKFENNDKVIDIGANTGDLKIYFDNKNIKVDYYGFEPGLIEFESLKINNKESRVFQMALGDNNSIAEFYYKPEFGDSSLVEMDGYSKKYQVEVMKLSNFFEKNQLHNQKIKFIKLEAEGFEPEILFGLGSYIQQVEFISADLGFERGINEETTAPQVLNYLLNLGFEIIEINGNRFVFLLKNKSVLKQ